MNIYDQIYNEKLGELIKDVQFITPNLRHVEKSQFKLDEINLNKHVLNALRYYSEVTLDCSFQEYETVYKTFALESPTGIIFMPEMFIALTAISRCTPNQLFADNEVGNYILIKRAVIQMQNT